MSRRTLEGLVLENRQQGERDALVTLALPEGIIRVFARGVQKETSKNRRLCLPFTLVQMETEQSGNGMARLIHGSLLQDYGMISEDLRMQAVCLTVNEALTRTRMSPALYARVKQLWEGCCRKDSRWLGQAVLVLALILQTEGIAPQVDACTVCGSVSGICTLDVESAGFLCSRHGRGRVQWKPDRLRRMRHAVKVPPGKEGCLDLEGYTLEDVQFLAAWFSRYGHSPLHSARFLESVVRLYPEHEPETCEND